MCSYVYMKILESRPGRYDRGISYLSFGQADRVRRRIAETYIRPGVHVLDVGCGTGTMTLLAAEKGATVVGFDVSPGMLAVAHRKIESAGLQDRIELHEMGVAGMDKLPPASFDLVVSTLVFSELSQAEREYALRHVVRVLKPGGRLAIADEVVPRSAWKRMLYHVVRLPVVLVTFALTQTTTRAVDDLEKLVSAAGLSVESARRDRLESFLYLTAVKETAPCP